MLTVCPTPIGNLDDVTKRQREALRTADVIACEDSRTTGKLLELLGIDRADGRPRLKSFHEHNEERRVDELVQALLAGEAVVVVSDAGTPGISDPGFRLVRAARAAGVEVTVLPGPVAAVVALAGSGLPTDRWTFAGFLPSKSKAREEALERLRDGAATAVLYESPHRVVALVEAVASVYGDVEVCVARELTKLHEEWLVGSADEVRARLQSRDRLRGEFVVVIAPGEVLGALDDVDDWVAAMIDAGIRPSTIKAVASAATGLSKSNIWDRMERLKSNQVDR